MLTFFKCKRTLPLLPHTHTQTFKIHFPQVALCKFLSVYKRIVSNTL